MTTVAVIGVGALGSHFIQLSRNLDATFLICDFDRVEQRNVMSQFHGKRGVNKSKVMALAQTMDFLWGLKLRTIPHKLVEDNVQQVLGDADLVVDCLDNGEGRRLVQRFVREHSIPCVHGALAADGGYGRVVWDEAFQIDDEPGEGAATCEDGEHLPFIAIVSAHLARAVQFFLGDGTKNGYEIGPTRTQRT